ncbi:hypothetical protein BC937DRAFT_94309 [Endogone sp. FLAS-F59071]|nr:hypothetical protein BC937DRAFT_94309 [Endogone sp. FLAS-F59071]|eukprot:RUS22963.1 hypothetical protein BC937DRAFT_94309 [Endogone sp. FLAS-F59071]
MLYITSQGVVASIFSFSRLITVRVSLSYIPKNYVPINEHDLPKQVYDRIQDGFARVEKITREAEPVPEDSGQPGWGRPEHAAMSISPYLCRHPTLSARHYIETLADNGLFSRRFAQLYVEGYERARFGAAECNEREYTDFLKLLALILKSMGWEKKTTEGGAEGEEVENENEDEMGEPSNVEGRSVRSASFAGEGPARVSFTSIVEETMSRKSEGSRRSTRSVVSTNSGEVADDEETGPSVPKNTGKRGNPEFRRPSLTLKPSWGSEKDEDGRPVERRGSRSRS